MTCKGKTYHIQIETQKTAMVNTNIKKQTNQSKPNKQSNKQSYHYAKKFEIETSCTS